MATVPPRTRGSKKSDTNRRATKPVYGWPDTDANHWRAGAGSASLLAMPSARASETKEMTATTPEQQLRAFIAKFAPVRQRLIRALRKTLRQHLPTANELVYDNYNFLVIAYCPTEKTGDSYFSLGADRNGANLFFGYTGTKLADPHHLLQGTGTSNRFLRLDDAAALARPEVEALIASSLALSKPPGAGKGKLIIRSISPKQRPRS